MRAGSIGRIGTYSDNDFSIVSNSTDQIRIKSNGNVGIGTSSPTVPLTVQGSTGANSFKTGDGTRFFRVYQDASNISLSADGSVNLDFYVGGAKRYKIDTDGDIEQNYINYTDGSNYEALKISAESDHILFKTESIGSFASNTRPILFKTGVSYFIHNSIKSSGSASTTLTHNISNFLGNSSPVGYPLICL